MGLDVMLQLVSVVENEIPGLNFQPLIGTHPQIRLFDGHMERDEALGRDPFPVGPFSVFFHERFGFQEP